MALPREPLTSTRTCGASAMRSASASAACDWKCSAPAPKARVAASLSGPSVNRRAMPAA
jgi:hypothetical protein